MSAGPAFAQAADKLAPLTKLNLNVVQFMPTTGDYRRWDALSGNIAVSPDGTIIVPALGSIQASNYTADGLASEIAARLQTKLGLIDRPDATVQIVDYPPIYLVGSVATPGQYPFRPGMTVLQAMAVAGGQYRSDSRANPTDTIRLQSDLQGAADAILRSTARLARLKAELADAKTIAFPPELMGSDPTLVEVRAQEQTIFDSRRNELSRQTAALNDLSDLYRAEIDALGQKSKSIDDQIKQAQAQLDGVKSLVDKGVVVVSRQTDLERAAAGLRSDRLDNVIATMSARQGLSEALRNLAKLEDNERSEVSSQLQTEQTNLETLRLNQTTTMRLLRQSTDFAVDVPPTDGAPPSLVYTIIRNDDGKTVDVAATESTSLRPGDLLKVGVGVEASAAQVGLSRPAASAGEALAQAAPAALGAGARLSN